jgi:hypothetical protein
MPRNFTPHAYGGDGVGVKTRAVFDVSYINFPTPCKPEGNPGPQDANISISRPKEKKNTCKLFSFHVPVRGKRSPKICELIANYLGFRKLAQLAENLK